jgi:nitrogen fixation-related uncharacterized protein
MLLGVAAGIVALKAGTYAELWSMKTKQDTEGKEARSYFSFKNRLC